MKTFNSFEILEFLCKFHSKYGMFFSVSDFGQDDNEIIKAAPWLSNPDCIQQLIDGYGWFLFDSKEEMEEIYYQTIGDDGPTETNFYSGSAKIYACTCGPDGIPLTENT